MGTAMCSVISGSNDTAASNDSILENYCFLENPWPLAYSLAAERPDMKMHDLKGSI